MMAFPEAPDWTGDALAPFEGVLLRRGLTVQEVARIAPGGPLYLATPYSKLAVDERQRWDVARSAEAQAHATRWARRFARLGVSAFAPITLSGDIVHHAYADHVDPESSQYLPGSDIAPLDSERWEAWCRPFLQVSSALAVPPVPGWDQSAGIWREACNMLMAMRPVYLLGEG